MVSLRIPLITVLFLGVIAVKGSAQTYQGGLRGAVRDATGVAPGAEVALINEETPEGGAQPRWSRDGREIFFRRRSNNSVMRIPIQTTPQLLVGKPERLFDGEYISGLFGPPDYDVTADGQRFLMVKPAETERLPSPIHIVVNWFEELKRRVPVRP